MKQIIQFAKGLICLVAVIIYLLAIISVSLNGGTTIISKGQAIGIVTADGAIYYKCDCSTEDVCKIIIDHAN